MPNFLKSLLSGLKKEKGAKGEEKAAWRKGKGRHDWSEKLTSYSAFKDLPEESVMEMSSRFKFVSAIKPNQTIIKQGEEGDAFYLILEGKFRVLREPAGENEEATFLAELTEGQAFGEEALISNARRNATVIADTKGKLLRLDKEDFVELVKEPKLKWVSRVQAQQLIDDGAKWLDVRDKNEYEKGTLPGAFSLPLRDLREQSSTLTNGQTYICICESGRQSATAAFLLEQMGFENIYVLRGGLKRLKR